MKINLPAQNVPVDTPQGVDPNWFLKLKQMADSFGGGVLKNTATTGFCYMPTVVGPPTGIPANGKDGFAPFVFDVTNNKLWIYNPITPAWKGIVLT